MGNFNRGSSSEPRRDFGRRSFGRQGFNDRGGDREMHSAVCSNCGKNCEVPFEPTGSKPVYCFDCFKKMGGGRDSKRFEDRGPRRDDSRPQNNEQLDSINRKLDKILEILTVSPVKEKKETHSTTLRAKSEGKAIIPQKKAEVAIKKIPSIKE